MRESDYYPAGAYNDPSAPWNEPDIPEKEFEVTVSQTLSKNTSVWTSEYIPGASGVDYEPDGEEGYEASGWHDPDDTSDTDFRKIYEDQAYTPLQIINAAEKLAKALIEEGKTRVAGIHLEGLIDGCKDWQEDDYEVIEE